SCVARVVGVVGVVVCWPRGGVCSWESGAVWFVGGGVGPARWDGAGPCGGGLARWGLVTARGLALCECRSAVLRWFGDRSARGTPMITPVSRVVALGGAERITYVPTVP